jgi:hypothetical protein
MPCAITIGTLEAAAANVAPFAVVATIAPAPVALAPLLVEEFCARTRGKQYANAAAPIAATATTLIRRKSFSVPLPGFSQSPAPNCKVSRRCFKGPSLGFACQRSGCATNPKS